MQPQEAVTAVVSGCALIALGIVPGLFRGLEERVRNLLETFSASFAVRGWQRTERATSETPVWLAVVGLALLAVGLFGTG